MNKKEKEAIKNKKPTSIMSDDEWARVQGMTHSEFQSPTKIKEFYNKIKKDNNENT